MQFSIFSMKWRLTTSFNLNGKPWTKVSSTLCLSNIKCCWMDRSKKYHGISNSNYNYVSSCHHYWTLNSADNNNYRELLNCIISPCRFYVKPANRNAKETCLMSLFIEPENHSEVAQCSEFRCYRNSSQNMGQCQNFLWWVESFDLSVISFWREKCH